jgi:glyoxylase-like metal-dependent hydrolase (beta-lactamase superfamily II)
MKEGGCMRKRQIWSLIVCGLLSFSAITVGASTDKIDIEVSRLTDYLLFFYAGRGDAANNTEDNWVAGAAMKLGIGVYALHQGNKAIVYDTMTSVAQAQWIKNYLREQLGIEHFTVVQSHWHLDHVAGNEAFKGYDIIAQKLTREIMVEKQAALEAGEEWGPPPINPLVIPNVVFNKSMDIYLGDLKLELLNYNIHTKDTNLIYIPKDKILLCGDTLEDTITYMVDIGELPEHLKGLQAMKQLDVNILYPNHGNPEVIRNGGYSKTLIDATANYISRMLMRAHDENFLESPLESFIGDALEKGWVTLWEPYREVHKMNLGLVHEHFKDKPLPDLKDVAMQ